MNLYDSGKKINENDILKLEKDLNMTLPSDYRNFMLSNNGGIPEDDLAFKFTNVVSKNESESIIQCFFIIYDEETYEDDDLRREYSCHSNVDLSANLLPIADDPGGNLICMSVSGEKCGTIYFCNTELEDPETGRIILSEIADSFSQFINNLYIFEG